MNTERMKAYGIDCAKGLRTCMGSEAMYKRILAMFLQDPCFTKAKKACLDGDQKELFSLVHEMKGTSGNAALVELNSVTITLAELVRHADADPNEVNRQFAALEAAYTRACEGIALLLTE